MGAISNKPRKNRIDGDLRDAVSLLPSARKILKETRFMPGDKEMQNCLGDLLLEWVKDEKHDDIDDFFILKQVSAMKFYSACEDNAYLDECLSIALSTIGKRIKAKVKDSYEFNMRTFPKYDSLSRLERKEKLQADKQRKEDTKFEVTVNRG